MCDSATLPDPPPSGCNGGAVLKDGSKLTSKGGDPVPNCDCIAADPDGPDDVAISIVDADSIDVDINGIFSWLTLKN